MSVTDHARLSYDNFLFDRTMSEVPQFNDASQAWFIAAV